MVYKSITALAPGACGELVQGSINGRDFLVTCPIDLWSRFSVFYTEHRDYLEQHKVFPKAAEAIHVVYEKKRAKVGKIGFIRESDIPIGKGMGSSTADIIAAYVATCGLLDIKITDVDEIADVALAIEPSDGLMYPGICLFDHRKGLWREALGDIPPLNVLIIDPGGEVDTLEFNAKKDLGVLNAKKEQEVVKALAYVREGIAEKDPEKIGRGTTISAKANQEILFKPQLEDIIKLSKQFKAMGVNVAHSGTVIGILLAEIGVHVMEAAEYIQKKFPQFKIYTSKIISGGIRYNADDKKQASPRG